MAMALLASAVLLASRWPLRAVVAARFAPVASWRPPAAHESSAVARPRHAGPAAGVAVTAALAVGVHRYLLAVACVVGVTWRALAERRRARLAGRAAAAALPQACRVLAAELRAGALPADALTASARASPEPLAGVLRAAASAERLGASAGVALGGAVEPGGLGPLTVCWQVCSATGAALAPTLEVLASAVAAELDAAAFVEAELAGVRLSALVMAALPAFGLALGAALGSDPVGFLLRTAAGRSCLLAAGALDVVGVLWVRALASRALR
jgi:tight adherence protein B